MSHLKEFLERHAEDIYIIGIGLLGFIDIEIARAILL